MIETNVNIAAQKILLHTQLQQIRGSTSVSHLPF